MMPPLKSRFPKTVPKGLHPFLYLQGLYTQTVLLCFWLVAFVGNPQSPSLFIDPLNSSTLELGAGEWVDFLLWASVVLEPSRLTAVSLAASLALSCLLGV